MATPCNSCLSAVINGVRAHEHGCPDSWKDVTFACRECEEHFIREDRNQTTCESCQEDLADERVEDDSELEDSLDFSIIDEY